MRGSRRRGRRPGTWELRLDAGIDPLNGRRLQRSVTFEGTAREADRRLAELMMENKHGRLRSSSCTVAELLEAGLEQAEAEGLERTTLRGYRRVAESQIVPALGTKSIAKLTAEDLDRFYRALAKAGYAQSTIHQVHVVLRRVLESARRWGWISYNPARDARPPRVPKPDPQPVTPEQIQRLLDCAYVMNPELAVCLTLAADTGARRGELCALRWTCLDLATGKVRFERSIGEADGTYEKDTKNHQHRTVTMSPFAVEALRAHRKSMRERALACGVHLADDAYVFSAAADGSTYWRPSTLSNTFRSLRDRAGLPATVKLHGLRHTQVTQLLDAGVPLRTVSGRVGHRNPSTTTNIYSHWIAETDERAADVVADRIWSNREQRR